MGANNFCGSPQLLDASVGSYLSSNGSEQLHQVRTSSLSDQDDDPILFKLAPNGWLPRGGL